ncbi:MAG: DUF1878 family protein [Bacillaceae bacterium]|nr:DUF1878 family protein [Bacillaceae bacterium]
MEKGKQSVEMTKFQMDLLMNVIDWDHYPFTKIIIQKGLTKNEFQELMDMLRELDEKYHLQKEEGLLDFTSLLVHFAGMLNEKLDPNETIKALEKEKIYPELMTEFINILAREED